MTDNKTVSALALVALMAVGSTAARAEDWTGFYAGVSAGPQYDQSKFKATSIGPNNVYGVSGTGSQKLDDANARVGGFVGWSMMVAPALVAGVEGDIYGVVSTQNDQGGLPGINYNGANSSDSIGEHQNYDASVRGRVGTTVGNFLFYGTAGGALRSLDVRGTCPGTGLTSWCGVSEGDSQSKTLYGWTAGVGAEATLMEKFGVRLEYRYADYGDKTATLFSSTNQGADQIGGKINLNTHIVTLGIVYHFGGM